MVETVANLGTDFLFSRLRGRWSRLVRGASLRRLADGRGTDTMRRLLLDRGVDPGDRAAVQKGLTVHLLEDLHAIGRLADVRTAAFYRSYCERFHLENLKTLLHARFVSGAAADVDYLLIRAPSLPEVDAEALAGAPTIHRFFLALPDHPLNPDLLPIVVELEDTRDMLRAEARIARLYFARFLEAARRLPVSSRGAGVELVRTEIDISNLIMELRNAALYGLPAERIREFRIPGGRYARDEEPEPASGTGGPAAVAASAPRPYARVLARVADRELYVCENALWSFHRKLALGYFRDFNRPAPAIVAYPFLKRSEVLDLGRMYEGLRLSLAPADILSMMIGGGDV